MTLRRATAVQTKAEAETAVQSAGDEPGPWESNGKDMHMHMHTCMRIYIYRETDT